MALQACSKIITDKLDIMSIVSELNSRHLLTQKDFQFLNNPTHEDIDKIHYLLSRLPRKKEGWFEKFQESLLQSPVGTAHCDIANLLSQKLKELETQDVNSIASISYSIPVCSHYGEDAEVCDTAH